MGQMILGVLATILLSLVIRWVGVEIGTWHKPICQLLVRVAAGHLPPEERTAAESEWLAVIEDMRSPTAQLLHSLSFIFSALRIRNEIAPDEAKLSSPARILIASQMAAIGVVTGATSTFAFHHKDALVKILYEAGLSRPAMVAIALALFLFAGVGAYVNHRLLMWHFSRRARRRATTHNE